ncbi:MAG: MerR family transcriptional regulator [Bacteroidota bacterium]|nr:MerR family transcriptional regulator [Bacteroidota bacterium]
MEKQKKIFYSIGEVAAMFNVNTSLIRFWEKEFDIIHPHKNKKGNRYFTKRDVDNFHLIFHLVKEKGYTLQGAKDRMRKNNKEVQENFEVVKTLKELKQFLLDIKSRIPE